MQSILTPAETDRDELTRDMYALASYLMRSANVGIFETIGELDVSFTQLKALSVLESDGEERSVKGLAEALGVSLPAMSRAVDGLVKKGLATRVEDPTDRRVRLVRITADGRDLVEQLTTVKRNGLEAFAATLTAGQRRKLDAAVEALMDRDDIAKTYQHLKEA
jgi:DNA-binding MarR family transcriptional regulator